MGSGERFSVRETEIRFIDANSDSLQGCPVEAEINDINDYVTRAVDTRENRAKRLHGKI